MDLLSGYCVQAFSWRNVGEPISSVLQNLALVGKAGILNNTQMNMNANCDK